MRIIIYGATGMVGQGALFACLEDRGVVQVLAVGRTATAVSHPKLENLVQRDLGDTADVESQLTDYDACFFCLGISSFGTTEPAYTRITYGLTMAVATVLARLNPEMTFVYVSGEGTDSTERGRTMWARVKGRTENALRRLPFKAVYLFRPGVIQPLRGIRSRTPAYRLLYAASLPLLTTLRRLMPRWILTTDNVGRAMIAVARHGGPKAVMRPPDIYAAASASAG